MSGTLTEDEFQEQCKSLISLSDKMNDGWELRQDLDDLFIVKNVKVPVSFREDITNANTAADTDSCQIESEDDDEMSMEEPDPCTINSSHHLITFEYHVVYSSTYSVPVLYFNAWHSNGKLLTVEEIWRIAPPCSDKYSYITQVDHPLLARPFYELHPCRTAQLMGLIEKSREEAREKKAGEGAGEKEFSKSGAGEGRYLVSWLSSLGRDVGLSMDIRYASGKVS